MRLHTSVQSHTHHFRLNLLRICLIFQVGEKKNVGPKAFVFPEGSSGARVHPWNTGHGVGTHSGWDTSQSWDTNNHSFTSKGNSEFPIHQPGSFWDVGGEKKKNQEEPNMESGSN